VVIGQIHRRLQARRSNSEKDFCELLENNRLQNCDYFPGVCNAILTRIPAIIEAENYGQEGYNRSYYVTDTTSKSAYYRKDEPVQIKLDSKDADQFWSEQWVELHPSEWVAYSFESLDKKKHAVTYRAAAAESPALLELVINNKNVIASVSTMNFSEPGIGKYRLKQGHNTITLRVKSGVVRLDWIKVD